jgi:hypothetical protein
MIQKAPGSPVNNNIQQEVMAIFLSLHGELNVAVNLIATFQEVVKFSGSWGLNANMSMYWEWSL